MMLMKIGIEGPKTQQLDMIMKEKNLEDYSCLIFIVMGKLLLWVQFLNTVGLYSLSLLSL